jgi:hypothetical protein
VQLAAELSVHPQSFVRFLEEGMPVARRGRGGRPSLYELDAVRAWLLARERESSMSPTARARARRDLAQAELAEQAFAIKAGTLLHREDVKRVWAGHVAAVKSKLLSMPDLYGDHVLRAARNDGLVGVQTVLGNAVRDVLRELAAG